MLNLQKIKKVESIEREINGGHQIIVFFDNGYGASIVRHSFSYGNERGLFELAVIKGNIDKWEITYKTHITDDVLGYLTKEDVFQTLEQVSSL